MIFFFIAFITAVLNIPDDERQKNYYREAAFTVLLTANITEVLLNMETSLQECITSLCPPRQNTTI